MIRAEFNRVTRQRVSSPVVVRSPLFLLNGFAREIVIVSLECVSQPPYPSSLLGDISHATSANVPYF